MFFPINEYNNSSPNGSSDGDSWSHWNGPTVRADGQGVRRVLYTQVALAFAGSGAARTCVMYLSEADGSGINVSGGLVIPSGSSSDVQVAHGMGMRSIGDGRMMRAGYGQVSTGRFNIGARAGGTIYNPYGNFTDRALTGYVNYHQCPAAPAMQTPELQPGGRVTIRFSGSGDTGDRPITGWWLQYATNAGFTDAVGLSSSGTSVLDLTPGQQYWFRAAGVNDVVSPYSETGVWSNVVTATMLSGGKIRRSGAWIGANPYIRDAGVWKPARVRVRQGTSWPAAK